MVPDRRITDFPGSRTAAILTLQFSNLCATIWPPIEVRSNFVSCETTIQKHVIYKCLSSMLKDVAAQLLSFRHWLPKMLTKATGRWRWHIQTQSQQTENSEIIVLEWDSQDSKSSVLIQAWKRIITCIRKEWICMCRSEETFLMKATWLCSIFKIQRLRWRHLNTWYLEELLSIGTHRKVWNLGESNGRNALIHYTIHKAITKYPFSLILFATDWTTEPVSRKNMETVLSSSYTRQSLP